MTIKKQFAIFFAVIFVLLLIVGVSNSFFILHEDECALVKQFGEIQKVYVKNNADEIRAEIASLEGYENVKVYEGAGIYFKIPFIDNVVRFSSKLKPYNSMPQQVITNDKKKLMFDNNAQWQIVNPLFFEITMGTESAAETRIDDIMYSRMREKVGKLNSTTVISDKELGWQMLLELQDELNEDLRDYGIRANDIRIRRTDVPVENHQSIYNRMITERDQMAAQYRSEGEEEAIKIRSSTDQQVRIILSEATSKAEILMGEGDALAAQIYNDAYGSNPGFSEFYNMLEMYSNTIRDNTTLVIPLDSPFAKYLLGINFFAEE
ncbi:MAG TPA: protease modulator HflC [Clostridiales bacterium]|jgi:membrane protease subunit HflC|nr:protease modulator HflC [Clostridiales bacterium]